MFTFNPQLKGTWPNNIDGLPFRWLDHIMTAVKPVWNSINKLRVVLDELRRSNPTANPTGGKYGVHRAQIVGRNQRLSAAALLIPKVRSQWMAWAEQAKRATQTRTLSRAHCAAYQGSEVMHGDIRNYLILGQWLHWIHE